MLSDGNLPLPAPNGEKTGGASNPPCEIYLFLIKKLEFNLLQIKECDLLSNILNCSSLIKLE